MLEKNIVQQQLEKTSAIIAQLKRQQGVITDAELSTDVLLTLRNVMKRVDTRIQSTSRDAENVLDELLEQRGIVADTTHILVHELDADIDEEDVDTECFLKQQAAELYLNEEKKQAKPDIDGSQKHPFRDAQGLIHEIEKENLNAEKKPMLEMSSN